MRLIIAGDFCERYRIANLISANKFENLFADEVRDIIKKADYSMVNFEFPIVNGDKKPIEKCGPNLRGTIKSIEAIKFAGFSCATLANNHILDYGQEALLETKYLLEESGIDTVGVGVNLIDSNRILYKQIGGKVLAVINCCEHEFGVATPDSPGANPLNPVSQYYSIIEARRNADYVLVVVHGGHEHWQLPSPRMVELYRFYIDCGADAVVNHHQHCYSGSELYKGKPIIYGLGNFCFDIKPIRTEDNWNYGCMAEIEFCDNDINYSLIPIKQNDEQPGVRLADKEIFEKRLRELTSIISNPEALWKETQAYYHKSMTLCASIMNPIQNRYIIALQRRKILPSQLKRNWLIKVQNFTICESHRDKMDYFFNNYIF